MQALREAQIVGRRKKECFFSPTKVYFWELTDYSLNVEVLYLNVSLFEFLEIAADVLFNDEVLLCQSGFFRILGFESLRLSFVLFPLLWVASPVLWSFPCKILSHPQRCFWLHFISYFLRTLLVSLCGINFKNLLTFYYQEAVDG